MPPSAAGDCRQGRFLYLDGLGVANAAQVADDFPEGDPVKGKVLAAGPDGLRELVGFRRGEDEDDVIRRLLQGFQKGVKGLRGQHVHLIHDIHLVTPFCRGKLHLVPQVPDFIHAPVGSRIDLHHIHQGTLGNPPARLASVARLRRRSLRQLTALAKILAVLVFPVPRGPLNR